MIHGLWRTQTLPAQHIHTPITICHVRALATVLKRDLFCVLFAGNVTNSMLNSKIKTALDCFIEYLPIYLGKLHFRVFFNTLSNKRTPTAVFFVEKSCQHPVSFSAY